MNLFLDLPVYLRYAGVIFGYVIFLLIAAGLALVYRRNSSTLKPYDQPGSIEKKAPIYILINVLFVIAILCPQNWKVFPILLALIAASASWELARQLLPRLIFPYGLPVLSAILVMIASFLEPSQFIAALVTVLFVLVILYALIKQRVKLGLVYLTVGACAFFLPFCLATLIWIRQEDPSGQTAIFLYLVVAINDIFAQAIGQLIGRRKLAPSISPVKTLEGGLGGLFFAFVAGAVLGKILDWGFLQGGIFGLALGLSGTSGDLVESSWKRALGIKNFSGWLGAQGGVLDRFDSLLFASPIFYFLLSFFR